MIVRISGEGQYELDDDASHRLNDLDAQLFDVMHKHDEQAFHRVLHEIIQFIRTGGAEVPHDRVVPSDVIVPPEDVTLEEAHRLFTDDHLLHPVEA